MTNYEFFSSRAAIHLTAYPFATHEARVKLFPEQWRESTKDLPHWAPTIFLANSAILLEKETGNYAENIKATTLALLCTSEYSKSVWARLQKRDPERFSDNVMKVAECCSIYGFSYSQWETLPRNERRKEHQKLLQALRTAATYLRRYTTEDPTAEHLEGLADNFESDPPYKKARILSATERPQNRILVFRLGQLFTELFGSPLYDNVARLSSAITGKEFSVPTVESICKGGEPEEDDDMDLIVAF